MTGYCKFCKLRIQGAAVPVLSPERGRMELMHLANAQLQHMVQDHPEQLKAALPVMGQFQAMVAAYCLDSPPVEVASAVEVCFGFELDSLRADLHRMLSTPDFITFSDSAPDQAAAGGLIV